MDAISFTVTDEATREALIRAAWKCAQAPLSESYLYGLMFDAVELHVSPRERAAARCEIDARIEALVDARGEVERLEEVDLGESIELNFTAGVLANQITDLRLEISEDEQFFSLGDAERRRQLDVFDAAGALLDILPEPVVSGWCERSVEAV